MIKDNKTPRVPVSWGELLDKITILEIKCSKLTDVALHKNAAYELALLIEEVPIVMMQKLSHLKAELSLVNNKLWEIEDKIRLKEKSKLFDTEFISLARSVYITNDNRSAIKREINSILRSEIFEVKSYSNYL